MASPTGVEINSPQAGLNAVVATDTVTPYATTLAAPIIAGASSLSAVSAAGITLGALWTILDGASAEVVVITSLSGTTVGFASVTPGISGAQYAHAAGATFALQLQQQTIGIGDPNNPTFRARLDANGNLSVSTPRASANAIVAAGAAPAAIVATPGYLYSVTVTQAGSAALALTDGPGGAEIAFVPANFPGGDIALHTPKRFATSLYTSGPAGTPAPQLGLVGEIPATSFTSGALGITISSLLPPSGMFPATLPLIDTTAQPTPPAVVEATRLLALDMLYEDTNPANVGIAALGDKHFRRGEDSAAKTAGSFARAESLLAPFRYLDVL